MIVPTNKLIEFTNMVNECCEVIMDEDVEYFLEAKHSFLKRSPYDEFTDKGCDKVYTLLRFIELGEADAFENKVDSNLE